MREGDIERQRETERASGREGGRGRERGEDGRGGGRREMGGDRERRGRRRMNAGEWKLICLAPPAVNVQNKAKHLLQKPRQRTPQILCGTVS